MNLIRSIHSSVFYLDNQLCRYKDSIFYTAKWTTIIRSISFVFKEKIKENTAVLFCVRVINLILLIKIPLLISLSWKSLKTKKFMSIDALAYGIIYGLDISASNLQLLNGIKSLGLVDKTFFPKSSNIYSYCILTLGFIGLTFNLRKLFSLNKVQSFLRNRHKNLTESLGKTVEVLTKMNTDKEIKSIIEDFFTNKRPQEMGEPKKKLVFEKLRKVIFWKKRKCILKICITSTKIIGILCEKNEANQSARNFIAASVIGSLIDISF